MRLSPHGRYRRWILTATAVLVAIPASASAAIAAPATLPHPVGDYLPTNVRTPAKVVHGGPQADDVLPASVDLRGFAPKPGDQGQIGSCVAWSIGYSIMGYYANRTGGAGAPYAPLFLYMRNVAPGRAPVDGLNPDAVLANATAAGVDTQDDYWQGTDNYQAVPTAAEIANAANYRVAGWTRLFNGAKQGAPAQTVVMQALASGNPVSLAIPVYQDFMYLRQHTLYTTVSGTNLGGHMVTAYGYDAQGVWIRNSWGTGWGNGGDVKVSWAFITTAAQAAYTIGGITTPAAPIAMTPTVGALSTVKASAGTPVTITGAGLASATAVRFGDTPATFTPLATGGVTKLVATAPAHASGIVDVTVTNASGTSAASEASKFTYVPAPPAVSALTPSGVSTIGGTAVTLRGTDLAGVASVKVGTSMVPATAVSATSLGFVAPAHAAGTVAVTVGNTYGTSTQVAQLVYTSPPAPAVRSVTPNSGLTYLATPVVLTGTELTGTTRVTAGGVIVPFVKVSATQLNLTLPVHPAGALTLQVTTPGGVSSASAGSTFTYRAPPVPAIAAVVPPTGLSTATTTVVLNGTAFAAASKVTANGVSVPFVNVAETQIRITLAARAAGTVALVVTTPGGTSAVATFTAVAPPHPLISSLSSATGATNRPTPLVITGTGLGGATRVTLGGVSLAFTKVSDTELRLTAPAHVAGAAPIVVTTPGGTSAAASFTYAAAPAKK
jgi:Papain family cysteine protease/IPT/TIG domain